MKQCVFGDHLKYGDMFIEKDPEGVVQCLDCAGKYKDDTVYTDGGGRMVGQFGVGYYKRVEIEE